MDVRMTSREGIRSPLEGQADEATLMASALDLLALPVDTGLLITGLFYDLGVRILGETRVDLHHLLEDLRDAYPGALEETILTEVVA